MSQFQLVMRSGPTPGVTFPLEGELLTIGRDANNGVAINDAEVSRKHARLMFQGGKFVIEDLGSTNGTFVNGQRLAAPAVLKPGDVVSLGEQIVLMYDAINIDPGATVATPRKYARPEAPRVAAPVAPSAPPASVPPLQARPAAGAPAAKGFSKALIFIIAAIFIFICLCVTVLYVVDVTKSWCVFPFNILAQMLGGVCQ